MGTAKTPEKAREYYLAWKANKPESYVSLYNKTNRKACDWQHICVIFRHILIDDFATNIKRRPK